ncbi:hypothetical protein [Mucilaginibacter phyllosphaerae]|uniref:Uncharacterized protein n=1 Tax=Mucilaginibacter phyllosphaerae TaxID=1812349 RepID=A0A4Y8AJE6_9SPHI|nr:hypothetical protein [Mucilaginibacter phyllosphaerae]MBB3967804.1 hypothetical protein [Mucilaginibacter phyllosphaerae]TEW69150.1 hypothetical protein E2R65_03000 [Mucilaginibacter phyllosphaerae]GGH03165.1 hypothetical protein GCM10007352_05790 [Mucilaginibacter phyllosphaerae]
MYWYNPFKKYTIYASVLLLLGSSYACNKPEIKETGAELKYFDLKGYFEKEATRLTALNPQVDKSVAHNAETESKNVRIGSWKKELNLFTESDINKPAWKLSYDVQTNADSTVYAAKYPELKTRRIVIRKKAGQVSEIAIVNNTHNILYNTTEKLQYAPGNYYRIEKTQKVKVMGGNSYMIKGKF